MVSPKQAAICTKHKNTLAPKVLYKIHPAIGVARAGDSTTEYFIGQEIPGKGPVGAADGRGTAVPNYKDGSGKIKRQAARFRIWRYVWNQKKCKYIPTTEVNADTAGIKKITWSTHLANRKSSFYNFNGPNGDVSPYGAPVGAFSADLRNPSITGTSRRALEIDPGTKQIEGKTAGPVECKTAAAARLPFPGAQPMPIDYLGELQTDNKGRLIVLGGRGIAKPDPQPPAPAISDYANNDRWFDDVSDGPVTAKIELNNGTIISEEEIVGAWVVVGPPDYAPDIQNLVTLYDTLSDVAIQHLKREPYLTNAIYEEYAADKGLQRLVWLHSEFRMGRGLNLYKASFADEIFPLLHRVMQHRWVFFAAFHIHKPYPPTGGMHWDWGTSSNNSSAAQAKRAEIIKRLRLPAGMTMPSHATLAGMGPGTMTMPKLLGDNYRNAGHEKQYASVTALQYALLKQWWMGKFDKDGWPASNDPADLPPPPSDISPEGLDRAGLETCVGGAFFPGIEVSWLIRNPALYWEPFRIDPWERHANGKIKKEASGKSIPKKIAYGSGTIEVRAGFFSQQMALPWQADFYACKKETSGYGWWPAQRPDDVYKTAAAVTTGVSIAWDRGIGGFLDLVNDYGTRGFIVKDGVNYLEKEGP